MEILQILQERFQSHPLRHPEIKWEDVESRLLETKDKIKILEYLESSGGEPDVVAHEDGRFLYAECSPLAPTEGRVSLCYDKAALASRKKNKPQGSAEGFCHKIGVELMSVEIYEQVQAQEALDEKNSIWLKTPADIRNLGGALFGDRRYGRCFIYHNGAESYYASRSFRCQLWV